MLRPGLGAAPAALAALLSTGCLGTLHTEDGREPVRAALRFDFEEPTQIGYTLGAATLVLALNSTLPCDPEEVEDDPDTFGIDEAGSAKLFWKGQILAALAREDALVVGFVLYREGDAPVDGRYALHEDTLLAPDARVEADGRAAAGFWYRVEEAGGDTRTAVQEEPAIEAMTSDFRVGAPAWVEVEGDDEGGVAGSFDLAPRALSGTFRASACDNEELRATVYAALIELGAL